ncbi:MAG: hypothetical protein HKO56_06400 [Bacteroidia bacterium]|nr:hypothetical protein [Bacteroidia bacterium]NNM16270.1 hypothetical protein [Bacteroidia bacterium]
MKKSTFNLFIACLFMAAFTLTSCGHSHENGDHSHDSDDKKTEKTIDMDSKEYASAYVCPMHCEGSGSDAEGKCPACKMDYVKNVDHHDHEGHTEHQHHDGSDSHDHGHEHAEGEDHDHDHEGHSH